MWVKSRQQGFTIVELLIVIVVIGVLAAIVIVSYNGITNSAHDSAVLSDLSNMAKKLEVEKASTGRYPFPPTVSTDIHIAKGSYRDQNNLYYCYDAATDRYAVQARSMSGNYFKILDGSASAGVASTGYSGEGTCDSMYPSSLATLTWTGSTGSLGHATGGTWAAWAQ